MKSNNISSLDISSCEKYLRTTYNIPENEIIRIIKLDIVRNDLKVNHVGYEFYAENGTKLEPNDCYVIISSPVKLNEGEKKRISFVSEQNKKFDIFDIKNDFYNDIYLILKVKMEQMLFYMIEKKIIIYQIINVSR